MALDSKLIKNFVRSSKSEQKTDKKFYYGKIKYEGGAAYVQLDGSSTLTPITTGVNISENDRVAVTLEGHSANVIGNITSPPTDDKTANEAKRLANLAGEAASEAQRSAGIAAQAATAAESSASQAAGSAQAASASAAQAATSASTASTEATRARERADAAERDASDAKTAATRANTAANSALTQLSIVEDVAGTLNWIQEHGTYVASTDTAVNPDKVYFTFDQTTQDYVPIVLPDTEKNPSQEGWYELDISDSQTDYIMAHLAVTSQGLWVLPSGKGSAQSEQYAQGYKILLSSTGMKLYDGYGREVTSYGESINLSSDRPQYIGGEDAFIVYYDSDNDGLPDTIRFGGNILMGGNKSLSELLKEVAYADGRVSIESEKSSPNMIFRARVRMHGEDVTRDYRPDCFVWSYKKTEPEYIGTGYSITIPLSEIHYGTSINLEFTKREYRYGLDKDGNRLLTNNGDRLMFYSEVN